MEMHLETLLIPETPLERTLIANEKFIEGCNYGKPRIGHPEGQVAFHIRQVLENVEKYSDLENREALRLISFIHDTFKYKVDRTKPKTGENHHAMIARKFAERYIDTEETLEIIELHDEAYNSWSVGNSKGDWQRAEKRAKRLIERLGDRVELYLAFYKCDNETGDKSRRNYEWFKDLSGIEPTPQK